MYKDTVKIIKLIGTDEILSSQISSRLKISMETIESILSNKELSQYFTYRSVTKGRVVRTENDWFDDQRVEIDKKIKVTIDGHLFAEKYQEEQQDRRHTKRIARWALFISIVAIVLTCISLYLEYIKPKLNQTMTQSSSSSQSSSLQNVSASFY